MAVFLTQEKKAKILAAAQALKVGRHLQVKHLTKFVGILVAAEAALGTFTSVMTRRIHAAIAETAEKHGWQAKVKISEEIANDAKEFARLLEDHDGTSIRTASTAISVLSIIGPPFEFVKTQLIAKHNTEAEVKI
jgi:hypothetical protein